MKRYRIDREAYRAWRNACPAELLSPLSQVHKWLGEPARPATPEPAESIPPAETSLSELPGPGRPAKLTPCQQDRLDCQAIARELWLEHPDWIQADLLKHHRIKSYATQWKPKTVLGWLSKVDPRLKEQRSGRPKKTR